jgi:hypothetical protein
MVDYTFHTPSPKTIKSSEMPGRIADEVIPFQIYTIPIKPRCCVRYGRFCTRRERGTILIHAEEKPSSIRKRQRFRRRDRENDGNIA